jgi:O-antigen ligase
MLSSLTGMSANQSYPAAAAAQSGFTPYSPVQSEQSNLFNFGLLAFVAMYLSTLLWYVAGDARPPPMGNDRNFYRMALVMSAGVIVGLALLRDPKLWPQAFPAPLLMLLFYGLLAMISSSFIPEYAFYSLWKSTEIVIVVLAAGAVLSYSNSRAQARNAYCAIVFLFTALTVLFAIEAPLMPDRALSPARGILSVQLRGALPVTPENALAFLSAVSGFAAFARLFRPAHWFKRALQVLFLVLAVVVLILAQSRTSFIGFCLAVLAYLWFDRRFPLLAVSAGLVLIAGVYASFFDIFSQYLLRGQDPTLVTSLSGRTPGWSQAWQEFQSAPLLGHGYAAYARATILGLGGPTSMHGALFEVMVGTGGLGLFAWGGAIIWTMLRLYLLPASGAHWFQTSIGRSMRAEMIGVAMLILLRGSTSSGLAENEDNLILFLSLLIYTETMRRITRQESASIQANARA